MLKIRKDRLVASDIAQYVDDVRIMASMEKLAWLCSSKMAKGLTFLGLQGAVRKRRMPSQTPGEHGMGRRKGVIGRMCPSKGSDKGALGESRV